MVNVHFPPSCYHILFPAKLLPCHLICARQDYYAIIFRSDTFAAGVYRRSIIIYLCVTMQSVGVWALRTHYTHPRSPTSLLNTRQTNGNLALLVVAKQIGWKVDINSLESCNLTIQVEGWWIHGQNRDWNLVYIRDEI